MFVRDGVDGVLHFIDLTECLPDLVIVESIWRLAE